MSANRGSEAKKGSRNSNSSLGARAKSFTGFSSALESGEGSAKLTSKQLKGISNSIYTFPTTSDEPSTSTAVFERRKVKIDPSVRYYDDFSENKDYYSLSSGHAVPTGKPSKASSEHTQRLTAFGVSLSTTVSDIVFVYPCLVLRRQCQVNNIGRKYHYTPFTIIAVAFNLQRNQGFTCLWKGISSQLIVNSITIGVETAVTELNTKFYKKDHYSKWKEFAGQVALKVFTTAVTMPFYSAQLVESIQGIEFSKPGYNVTIAKRPSLARSEAATESPGVFHCVTEGFSRLLGLAGVQSRRLLPFRYLLLPTVLHFTLRYILVCTIQYGIIGVYRLHAKWEHDRMVKRNPSRSTYMSIPSLDDPLLNQANSQYVELLSSFIAQLVTDVFFYPLECVIHRLHVQGTRSIIDNMDRGSGFLPVSSRYEGFFDCLHTIRTQEGTGGLYRGFGGLILQHCLKFAVLKFLKFALDVSQHKSAML